MTAFCQSPASIQTHFDLLSYVLTFVAKRVAVDTVEIVERGKLARHEDDVLM